MKSVLSAFALSAAALGAQAVTLDFSGSICADSPDGVGAFAACGNGRAINQAYGDSPGVDFSFRADDVGSNSMAYWFDGYSGLFDVAYGNVPVITLAALNGEIVTLQSFQLGAWPFVSRTSQVTVTELVTGNVLRNTGNITIDGSVPSTFSINASSANGFQIVFGPDGFNVGIDNIVYSTSPIPEPGTWALMALGLAGVGSMVRRRKTA
jgi:hypothetical protein